VSKKSRTQRRRPTTEPLAVAGDGLLCDFCNRPVTAGQGTAFPCADFPRRAIRRGRELLLETCTCHTPVVIEPGDEITEMPCLGAWLACQDCRPFVAAGDRDGLAALAATHLSPAAVPSVPAVVAPIDRLDQETAVDDATGWAWLMHAGYWLHRTSAS
jgi:hypothetical protein